MDQNPQNSAASAAPKPPSLWRWLLEPAAVLILACGIVGSVAVIAWRRHRLGDDIRVVESPDARFRVNVNRAGKEELMLLPGIGEKRAEGILSARRKGPFGSLEEVRLAGGMSPKQFQPVRDLITLGRPGQVPESGAK